MAFFQNKNTLVYNASLGVNLQTGVDTVTDTSWASFIAASPPATSPPTQHSHRREAFEEFIYLMFLFQSKEIDHAYFPHNILYDKALKFFVETRNSGTAPSIKKVPIYGASGTLTAIFSYSFITHEATVISAASAATRTPKLRTNFDDIQKDIKRELFLGQTSIGFFQEAATLFAYYYSIRQLSILNGYNWDVYSITSPLNNIISRTITNPTVPAYPTPVTLDTLSTDIIAEIDKPEDQLPYLFNSLFYKMGRDNTSTNSNENLRLLVPSNYSTDEEKVFAAFFVKLLDPWRALGGKGVTTRNYSVEYQFNPTYIDQFLTLTGTNLSSRNNTFLMDLYVLLREGNMSGYDRPKLFNPPATFSGVGNIEPYLKSIHDGLLATFNKGIEYESRKFMEIMVSDIKTLPESIILGSGVGDTSVSIMGIRNFGLCWFNYDLNTDASAKTSNTYSRSMIIDCAKSEKIHIGAYGLDLDPTLQSTLTIKVDTDEIYSFKFSELASGINYKDIAVVAEAIGPTSIPPSPNFKTYVDPLNTDVVNYLKVLKTGTPPVLVAQYISSKRDLVFRKFTDLEFGLYPGLTKTKTLAATIISKGTLPSSGGTVWTYEEMMVSISKYESEDPELISDDVRYDPFTFQLVNAPGGSTNETSNTNLFKDPLKIAGLKAIFDLLEDKYNSVINVTLKEPVLLGGYIGKQSLTTDSKVVADTAYQYKYDNFTKTEIDPTPKQKNLYDFLKYSRLVIDPAVNATTGDIEISLSIISYVSPSTFTSTHLDSFYSGVTGGASKKSLYDTKRNAGSFNQVLAMLRSFGLLEALIKKMNDMVDADSSYGATVKSYIKDEINDNWFAASVTCKDDPMKPSDHVVLTALDITLPEYNSLKKW